MTAYMARWGQRFQKLLECECSEAIACALYLPVLHCLQGRIVVAVMKS